MAKLSRSAFLYSLGATGAFILAGCGSGTTKNTTYGGSYRSAYTIPQLNEAGAFNFTVDVKGNLTGSIDNQSGTVREVSGTVKSDGSFEANTLNRATNTTGRITGTMSGTGAVPVIGAAPTATPIVGGNFSLTEGNVPNAGSFLVDGIIAAPGTSGYQGSYSGIYTIPGLKQNGTTSFSVDASGKMTGLFTRDSATGSLNGSITSGGNFTATVAFGAEVVNLSGVLTKTTDNSTQGNFTLTQGGQSYVGSLGKSEIPPTAGNSAYAGSYRGTYSIPERGENGNTSLTVDPSGAFTGFLSQTNDSPVGTFTGTFNNDGRFEGSVTYAPASGLAPRPITGRLGTSTLSGGGQAGDFVIVIDGVPQPGNFELSVGGSQPVSNYRASYTDANLFPDAFISGTPQRTPDNPPPVPDILRNSNSVEFSVDKEGSILGTFGAYPVTGRVTEDGRVVGTIKGEGERSVAFRGIMNKLNWTFRIAGADVTRPGIKGDFIFTFEGVDYTGYIKVTGGDGITK